MSPNRKQPQRTAAKRGRSTIGLRDVAGTVMTVLEIPKDDSLVTVLQETAGYEFEADDNLTALTHWLESRGMNPADPGDLHGLPYMVSELIGLLDAPPSSVEAVTPGKEDAS